MDESLLLGLYTADVMRQIDVTAIQGVGIPGGHLMERAGLAVARKPEKRKAAAAPPRERSHRAGAPDLRRGDTRFSEIWNDRR